MGLGTTINTVQAMHRVCTIVAYITVPGYNVWKTTNFAVRVWRAVSKVLIAKFSHTNNVKQHSWSTDSTYELKHSVMGCLQKTKQKRRVHG